MSSSSLFKTALFAVVGVIVTGGAIVIGGVRAQTTEVRMLVQSSPLAGFQYHHGKALWDEMKVGDALTLVREAGNPHDGNAVRVEWQGRPLGYVPRRENRTVAQHIDRGGAIEARISKLVQHRNPWQRVEFEIFVRL